MGVRGIGRLLVLALVMALAACTRTPPEQRLRAQVEALRVAVQQRELGDAMDLVAEDFSGNDGLDRQGLRRLLQARMLAHLEIDATLVGPMSVQIDGERATVTCDVLLTGGSGRLLPDSAGGYAVTSGWRLDGGEWKLYYADWQRRGP